MLSDQTATVRLASLARLDRDDMGALRQMAGPILDRPVGSVLQTAGDPVTDPVLLLSGWTSSSVTIDGGGRQIVKVNLPGDLLGLTSLPFAGSVDTVTALTDVQICTVSRAEIGHLFTSNPRLAALLFLISLEERVALVDRLAMVGRAETSQRIAAVILQLRERMIRSEPATDLVLSIPLTQLHVADMVGATLVHVSRVIQELASKGLMKWERGRIKILNLEALQAFAGLPSRELVREPAWLPSA